MGKAITLCARPVSHTIAITLCARVFHEVERHRKILQSGIESVLDGVIPHLGEDGRDEIACGFGSGDVSEEGRR